MQCVSLSEMCTQLSLFSITRSREPQVHIQKRVFPLISVKQLHVDQHKWIVKIKYVIKSFNICYI